jgi:DNA (cytosine-5)-methyltransferase 1
MADDNLTPVIAAPTFIDLFCGCGGFSLGMVRAGLRCLAAIDFNGGFREGLTPGIDQSGAAQLTGD